MAPKRRKPDPVKTWVKRLDKTRPNLMNDTLDALRTMYGQPEWKRVYNPTSELILTMLSANSADINAEKAFDLLCKHWPPPNVSATDGTPQFRKGWGGVGIKEAAADWAASSRPEMTTTSFGPKSIASMLFPFVRQATRVRPSGPGLAERGPALPGVP
jgi:hypothetical protein